MQPRVSLLLFALVFLVGTSVSVGSTCELIVTTECSSSLPVTPVSEAQLLSVYSELFAQAASSFEAGFTWNNSFTYVPRNVSAEVSYVVQGANCSSLNSAKAVRCVNNKALLAVCVSTDTTITTSLEPSSSSSSTSKRAQRLRAEKSLRNHLLSSSAKAPRSGTVDFASLSQKAVKDKSSQGAVEKILPKDIAIVTMLGETGVKGYTDMSDYHTLAQLTLQSMSEYATHWGHPFFFLNSDMMEQNKQAYWAKIDLVTHYLEVGYEYVLYTDVDVLFLQKETPLTNFIVPGKEIISVTECYQRNSTKNEIRSGFMIFHNSRETLDFLSVWKISFAHFKDVENPEQSALEVLSKLPDYEPLFHLHSWRTFHAYDTCDHHQSAFSIHFPGKIKVPRVGRSLTWFIRHRPGAGIDASDSQALSSMFGSKKSTVELAAALTKHVHIPPNPDVKILDRVLPRVKQCLEANRRAGHVIDPYNATLHQRIVEYDVASYFFPIPTVIYLAVPDSREIPKKIAANILRWMEMNPGFEVVVYGDAELNALVLEFLDVDPELWSKLKPVQRTDIWRYLVLYLFGGWYFDADTECARPISHWDYKPSSTLVLGVEAESVVSPAPLDDDWGSRTVVLSQYAFGAAARHPALGEMLNGIVSQLDTLAELASDATSDDEWRRWVLSTTGPWAWTDVVASYICYADTYPNSLDDSLSTLGNLAARGGGMVLNTRIFNIEGFGAGQGHSSAPSINDAHASINAVHHFGASATFHGLDWTSL